MQPQEQFDEFYQEHVDAIYRFAFFRLHDHEQAKDMTQAAFVKIWRQYGDRFSSIEHPRALLYKIMRNLLVDYYRRSSTTSLEAAMDEGFAPEDSGPSPSHFADQRLAVRALSSVPEPYRTAVELRYIEQLSPKEIAELTETNENVVSVRIHRGLKKLRASFV